MGIFNLYNMKTNGALEKMKSERFQKALDDFTVAITEMQIIVGEDNFNFVASISVFDDKIHDIENEGDFDNDGIWWSLGDYNECETNAECLLDEIRKEEEIL